MELIPTQEEVLALLRQTKSLHDGHFVYPGNLHANQHVQVAQAMRYYQHAKTLSVALSRKLRANPELRAMMSEISIVAPATGGLPVAYGVCEALRAKQVYWAEREVPNGPLMFRQYLERSAGEKVILVDDLIRRGKRLSELKELVESNGSEVVAIAVMLLQAALQLPDYGVPMYHLAKLETQFYPDEASCELCRQGIPSVAIRV